MKNMKKIALLGVVAAAFSSAVVLSKTDKKYDKDSLSYKAFEAIIYVNNLFEQQLNAALPIRRSRRTILSGIRRTIKKIPRKEMKKILGDTFVMSSRFGLFPLGPTTTKFRSYAPWKWTNQKTLSLWLLEEAILALIGKDIRPVLLDFLKITPQSKLNQVLQTIYDLVVDRDKKYHHLTMVETKGRIDIDTRDSKQYRKK